jgi:hypothetical protein
MGADEPAMGETLLIERRFRVEGGTEGIGAYLGLGETDRIDDLVHHTQSIRMGPVVVEVGMLDDLEVHGPLEAGVVHIGLQCWECVIALE